MIAVSVQRSGGKLGAYLTQLSKVPQDVPLDLAHHIRDEWASRVPVRTGAYQASIYVEAPSEHGYAAAAGAARGANPHAPMALNPPMPDTPNSAVVGSAVDYAAYVEYGTSRTPARPAFTPAVESARRSAVAIAGQRLRITP
jgi:hypothetical protein